jgi:hypothetical protein
VIRECAPTAARRFVTLADHIDSKNPFGVIAQKTLRLSAYGGVRGGLHAQPYPEAVRSLRYAFSEAWGNLSSDVLATYAGTTRAGSPRLIGTMSFRLAIPGGLPPAAPASASPATRRMRYSGPAGRGFFSERPTVSYSIVSA